MNGMRLPCPRRTIKQQAFLDREAQLSELLTLLDEAADIAIKQFDGLCWQDNFFFADLAQFVHSHRSPVSGIAIRIFERNDLSAIRSGSLDQVFKPIEHATGKIGTRLTRRNTDLDMGAVQAAKENGWAQKQRKRH